MKTLGIVFTVTVVLLFGCSSQKQHNTLNDDTTTGDYYTCVMHPSVHLKEPGVCPICGMTLVKKSAEKIQTGNDSAVTGIISLSPRQRMLANIGTSTVERRTLQKQINAVGVIDIAEPNLRHITMRYPGRLEQLYLTYTGQRVRQGDPVAEVYSPEAISAQQEFILAAKAFRSVRDADSTILDDPTSLFNQSKQKLLLWGFTSGQIDELQRTLAVKSLVTMYSPITGTVIKKNVDPQHYAATGEVIYDVADLSTVWMNADVYEQDIRFIKIGQRSEIISERYQDESFSGTVAFIDPVMNADTRTIRVRTELSNVHGKLKPQMYVAAKFFADIPTATVVPISAVLSTGKRNIVWVEISPAMFEPRDVELGAQTDLYYEILSGIHAGETIVTTGGFLLDSESSLQNPLSGRAHAGHSIPNKEQ